MGLDDDLAGIDLGDLDASLEAVAEKYVQDHPAEVVPLETVAGSTRHCKHTSGLLHPGIRRLTCRDCGADLDAYDFLLYLSRDTTAFKQAAESARRRADEAQDRLDCVLREERNAKARRRRRTGNDPNA